MTDDGVPADNVDLLDEDALLDPYPHYPAAAPPRDRWCGSPDDLYAIPRYGPSGGPGDPGVFCSGRGVALNDFVNEAGQGTTLASDGELHDHLRRIIEGRWTPTAVSSIRAQVAAAGEVVVDKLLERSEFDAVDADLGQVEPNDAVECSHRFGLQPLEHTRCDPLVASGSQRRVRHPMLQDRFGVDPRAAGGEADQHPQKQTRSGTPPMTSPSGCSRGGGISGSIAAHVRVHHFGLEARIMSGDLPGRLAWVALGITAEPTPPTGGWSPHRTNARHL